MLTDEAIETKRRALEPLIGRTRADWYADACRMEAFGPGDEDGPEALLWACRYREVARQSGESAAALLPLAKEIREKVEGLGDLSLNPDRHVELTLTVAECRAIVAALAMSPAAD